MSTTMSKRDAVKDRERSEDVNHNKYEKKGKETVKNCNGFKFEMIKLPNDGQVEILASRPFGKPVKSSQENDAVEIIFDNESVIHIHVETESKSRVHNILTSCGARIPHGPTVLDILVSSVSFTYATILVILLAHIREERRYMSILLIWFFYVIVRVRTYSMLGEPKRKIWHFSGISFSLIFVYLTMMMVFPMLIRDVNYRVEILQDESQSLLIMSYLKANVGIALLGMAARRSFHCGKIIHHIDLISSLLLGNMDIFNLIESLSERDQKLPLLPEGSIMEIAIIVACELGFLVIIFEAIMPYSLITLDKKNVGQLKYHLSLKQTKEQAIVLVYPYSMLAQNIPFLAIRFLLLVFIKLYMLDMSSKISLAL